jgi:hypothetical protein
MRRSENISYRILDHGNSCEWVRRVELKCPECESSDILLNNSYGYGYICNNCNCAFTATIGHVKSGISLYLKIVLTAIVFVTAALSFVNYLIILAYVFDFGGYMVTDDVKIISCIFHLFLCTVLGIISGMCESYKNK